MQQNNIYVDRALLINTKSGLPENLACSELCHKNGALGSQNGSSSTI